MIIVPPAPANDGIDAIPDARLIALAVQCRTLSILAAYTNTFPEMRVHTHYYSDSGRRIATTDGARPNTGGSGEAHTFAAEPDVERCVYCRAHKLENLRAAIAHTGACAMRWFLRALRDGNLHAIAFAGGSDRASAILVELDILLEGKPERDPLDPTRKSSEGGAPEHRAALGIACPNERVCGAPVGKWCPMLGATWNLCEARIERARPTPTKDPK